MAKARTLDAKLAELKKRRGEPASPALAAALRAALADSSNFLAAEAAEQAGTAGMRELAPDLKAAFARFLEDGEATDKQCRAKLAILETLNQWEFDDEEFWWSGARYTQLEGVWGGSQDTAAPIRVACAFSLVRLRARGALPYLADLLCDPEKPARAGAAQALVCSNSDAAALLLRLKSRLGDKDSEVLAECYGGLISLTPKEGVALVADFLDSEDLAVKETALLALGESRLPEALVVLRAFWKKAVTSRLQETLLTAIGLLRLAEGIDFLLEIVADEERTAAKAALGALAIHRHDERLRPRVAAAAEKNGHPAVKAHFKEAFRAEGD